MFNVILENLKLSASSVFANKSRSMLTALGIVIGVLAVTVMGTLISGLDKSFDKSMSFLGRDVLFVGRMPWFSDVDWWEIRNRPRMKMEYSEKLKSSSALVKAAAPISMRTANMAYEDKSIMGSSLFGTIPEYTQTISMNIKKGRFITEGEHRSGSRVTVIGYDIAQALFEDQDPLGKHIKIQGYKFRVIGVVEKQGKFLGLFSMDNQAFIPLGTQFRLFSRRGWMRINVKVDENRIEEAKEEVRGIMRRLRGLKPQEKDNFAINQQEAFEKQYRAIKLAIGGTGVFITILSLVVGGIGIMNIMFVTVKERTREIGIRKAIGATRNMILGQFLMEAVMICLLGGLAGLLLAYGASFLISQVFPSTMPLWLAIGSVFLSLFVGVFSGLVPAYKAAKLDPIEALRYE
ncbi:MAG: ABC transporter permease [Candidatus Neomarinimicrobiota bacterium]